MKFKNYARFKRKKIKQKQETGCYETTDNHILYCLSRSKTFSEQKEYLRQEMVFCDLIQNRELKKRKRIFQKELQELEVYSANEL